MVARRKKLRATRGAAPPLPIAHDDFVHPEREHAGAADRERDGREPRLGQVAAVLRDAVALWRRAVLRRERRLRHCGGGVQPTERSRRWEQPSTRDAAARSAAAAARSSSAASQRARREPHDGVHGGDADGPRRARNAAAAPPRPRRPRHAALAQLARLPRRRQRAGALAQRRRLREHLIAHGARRAQFGAILLCTILQFSDAPPLPRCRRRATTARRPSTTRRAASSAAPSARTATAAGRSTCAAAAPRARSTRASAPST